MLLIDAGSGRHDPVGVVNKSAADVRTTYRYRNDVGKLSACSLSAVCDSLIIGISRLKFKLHDSNSGLSTYLIRFTYLL